MDDLLSVRGISHLAKEIGECLGWVDNARLRCTCRTLSDALIETKLPIWWGQAQSTSGSEEGLFESFCRAAQSLRPSARPNLAMLMIDTALVEITPKRLCGRLHSANLVPVECPILVIDNENGVFGATTGEEGNFSQYEGRDVELDPVAPVTCVLTVAHVPPEEPSAVGAMASGVANYAAGAGGVATIKRRVCCFLADGQAQSPAFTSASFVDDWEGQSPVWMDTLLPRGEMKTFTPTVGAGAALRRCSRTVGDGGGGVDGGADAKGRASHAQIKEGAAGAFSSIHEGNDVCEGPGYTSRSTEGSKSPRSRSVDGEESWLANAQANNALSGGGGDGSADSGWSGGGSGAGISLKRTSSEGENAFPSQGGATAAAAGNDTASTAAVCPGGRPFFYPRLQAWAGSFRCRPLALPGFREPSSAVPLEDADTILLIGTHLDMLDKTAAWLGNALPNAVILGGLSNCSLVIGDEVYSRKMLRKRRTFGPEKPLVIGVALKGVRALAVSAKGFGGVGSIFRVDNTIDGSSGNTQARPGKILREVTVVAEGHAARSTTAGAIFYEEVLNNPAWNEDATQRQTVFLGVGSSPEELLCSRGSSGSSAIRSGTCVGDENCDERAIRAEEATGLPPVSVNSVMGQLISLQDNVVPGQYARYMRTQAELSLADTEAAFLSCKRRIAREKGIVLSSVHFTCSVRPDRLEAVCPSNREQGQGQGQGQGQDAEYEAQAPVLCVMALHQQEVVRFCRTMNAPAAGLFCQGELGPLPTLVGGILPNTSRSRLQAFSTCTAVLYWNPNSFSRCR